MSDPRSRTADAALTVGAVLGLLCIVASVAAVVFGITPLVFRSGSMAPAIPTGSLAVGRDVPVQELRSGDVVSVERSDGSRITHRVEAVDSVVGNSATLQLKGDANDSVDAEPYTVTSAVRVLGHVPYLGYFVAWLSTPFAWALGALLSAALIRVAFVPRAKTPEQGPRHARHSTSSRSAVTSIAVVAVVASAVGVGAAHADLTEAAITDTAYGRASLTAGSLPRPTSFTCMNGTLTANLSWVASNPTFGHRLTYTNSAGTQIVSNVPAGQSSTTPPNALLNVLTQWTVTLQSTAGSFVSTQSLSRTVRTTSLIGLGLISTCVTSGTTTTTTNASARSAPAPAGSQSAAGVETSTAPSVSTTTTTSMAETTFVATSPTGSTSSPTPAASTPVPATPTSTTSVEPAPTTTTTTTTTPPPPPASAFVADGGSATSGTTTASVAGNTLTLTGPDGTSLYSRTLTPSARYGSGVVFSTTGGLYVLADSGVSRIVVANGVATESAASTADLPADISALL